MIPKNIRKEHILKALERIDRTGMPQGRESKKFLLEHDGKSYPPKYVVALANKYANGKELDSEDFGGGNETNGFLRKLGFTIRSRASTDRRQVLQPREEPRGKQDMKVPSPLRQGPHNERCPKCKETIARLLKAIYGEVETSWKAGTGTIPEDFRRRPYYEKLKKIYQALQKHSGHQILAKQDTLPPCDYYVPDPGFVVEFDERQHFTTPRRMTLEQYPESLEVGFDKERWTRLCESIDARDNDPTYRDEQRAWYDTLRDFLPTVKGLKPTVRLYTNDYVWCSLDPYRDTDLNIFRRFVEGKTAREWNVEVIADDNPLIGRVVIAEEWHGDPDHAKEVLDQVCQNWPSGVRVNFLITCGGFIQFDWPAHLTRGDIGDNRDPDKEAVDILVARAKKCADDLLRDGLREKLVQHTDYLTFGIDSHKEKISTTQNTISHLHTELVLTINLETGQTHSTGKTYPTNGQERGLVRITSPQSHFLETERIGKVMVLGCHDLTLFNNRNEKNTGPWRTSLKKVFRATSRKEKPIVVLQHPHTTVAVTTWRNAWSTLRKTLPTVQYYAGAGVYYEPDSKPSDWDPVDEVLAKTKWGPVLDFILKRSAIRRRKA